MAQTFKKGDTVTWETAQGKTRGKVKQKLTSPIEIKGHHVAASEENPLYPHNCHLHHLTNNPIN